MISFCKGVISMRCQRPKSLTTKLRKYFTFESFFKQSLRILTKAQKISHFDNYTTFHARSSRLTPIHPYAWLNKVISLKSMKTSLSHTSPIRLFFATDASFECIMGKTIGLHNGLHLIFFEEGGAI